MSEPVLLRTRDELWSAAHTERAALAEDLAHLDDEQWAAPSLCGRWTVQEVVAHLTAAASIGRLRWFRSALAARFDFDLHNARRLAEHRGADPAETLDRFRAVITRTTAPSGHTPAWLGEVVVHARTSADPSVSAAPPPSTPSPPSRPSTRAATSPSRAGPPSPGSGSRPPTDRSPTATASSSGAPLPP